MKPHPAENDSTARRTRQLLAESMKRLLTNRPLEKISVSDIAKDCCISRNTFYYHFRDKYDLVIWIFDTETADWLFAEEDTEESDVAILMRLSDYFRENRAFYRSAMSYEGQNSLRDHLYSLVYQRLEARLRRFLLRTDTPEGERELRFAAEFYTTALTGLFVRWVLQGMEEDIEGYHDCLWRILSGELLEGYLNAGREQKQ